MLRSTSQILNYSPQQLSCLLFLLIEFLVSLHPFLIFLPSSLLTSFNDAGTGSVSGMCSEFRTVSYPTIKTFRSCGVNIFSFTSLMNISIRALDAPAVPSWAENWIAVPAICAQWWGTISMKPPARFAACSGGEVVETILRLSMKVRKELSEMF